MFGKNPIRHADTTTDTLAVQEIFYTIQGEGPQAGRPSVFVRLAGCNLACTFCDTEFESGINNRLAHSEIAGSALLAAAVARLDLATGLKLVVLTGGEPLRQNILGLLPALARVGIDLVQIETAGTLWLEGLAAWVESGFVQIVCSPKTRRIHPSIVRWTKHYKYIIEDGSVCPDDGLPLRGTQQANAHQPQRLFRPWDASEWDEHGTTVWVSPCDAHDAEITARNTQRAVKTSMLHGYRLSLQVHKIVNLP